MCLCVCVLVKSRQFSGLYNTFCGDLNRAHNICDFLKFCKYPIFFFCSSLNKLKICTYYVHFFKKNMWTVPYFMGERGFFFIATSTFFFLLFASEISVIRSWGIEINLAQGHLCRHFSEDRIRSLQYQWIEGLELLQGETHCISFGKALKKFTLIYSFIPQPI